MLMYALLHTFQIDKYCYFVSLNANDRNYFNPNILYYNFFLVNYLSHKTL